MVLGPEAVAVRAESVGAILVLTINRPDVMNAINQEVATRLGSLLRDADADLGVRAVVITGAGDRAFCAGADLKAIARGEDIRPSQNKAWGFAGIVRHAISVPLIAAVEGFALGGGTEIVLSSDIAVAAEHAIFGLPEVTRGRMAGGGGAFRLPIAIPQKLAMELLLTGDHISAHRALELGLVNRVVSRGTALSAAMSIAQRISRNAPLAVRATKWVARGWSRHTQTIEPERWQITREEYAAVTVSDDLIEGARAFAEKRLPQWSGR